MTVTIYHNPRCSKSRQTLALIEERGIEPKIVRYIDHAPSAEDLKRIITMLGIGAQDLIRTGESDYKELALKGIDDEKTLLEAMASHPALIQRPIVIAGQQARIGRPPEKVLEILP